MKIDQDSPEFSPVSITFETKDELKRFLDDIGQNSEPNYAIPYSVFLKLYEILNGSSGF